MILLKLLLLHVDKLHLVYLLLLWSHSWQISIESRHHRSECWHHVHHWETWNSKWVGLLRVWLGLVKLLGSSWYLLSWRSMGRCFMMHFLFNVFLNHRGFVLNDDWSLFCFSVSNNLNGLLNHFFDNSFHLSGSGVSRARFFLLGFGFVNTFCTLIFTSFSFFGLSLWFALFFGDFVGMT